MTTVTQWFNIRKDGQPTEPGWWDALYEGDSRIYRRWWDGQDWLMEPCGARTMFGLYEFDDCYRGLAAKPKSGIKTRKPQAK